MHFKHVLFEDTFFDECYFEDVTSTDTYFKNCTIESTIFYNTGEDSDEQVDPQWVGSAVGEPRCTVWPQEQGGARGGTC